MNQQKLQDISNLKLSQIDGGNRFSQLANQAGAGMVSGIGVNQGGIEGSVNGLEDSQQDMNLQMQHSTDPYSK